MKGPLVNDPEWAREDSMPPAKVWEDRAKRELERARRAGETLAELRRYVDEMEHRRVKAVGRVPDEAILSFCNIQWPGEKITDLRIEDDGAVDANGLWGARCRVGGTGMKFWGINLPGGCGLTGWK